MKPFSHLENINEGLTCIIMGNGPSLLYTPRELLAKYDTFGANSVFLLEDFTPTYYTVSDQQMVHTCIPFIMEHWVGQDDEVPTPKAMFIRRDYPVPGAYP